MPSASEMRISDEQRILFQYECVLNIAGHCTIPFLLPFNHTQQQVKLRGAITTPLSYFFYIHFTFKLCHLYKNMSSIITEAYSFFFY